MPKLSKKALSWTAAAAGVVLTAPHVVKTIGPNQFGLRTTFGVVTSGVLKPGVYLQFPVGQVTHIYHDNTQSIGFNAGSNRFIPTKPSTADQNILTASVILHYKVKPDLQKLSYRRWSMENWFASSDGYWVLTDMMNDSANAVLGRKPMAQTLVNPQKFGVDFFVDLRARIEQNNIPVEIQGVELKKFNTTIFPTRTVSYQVIKPEAPVPGR